MPCFWELHTVRANQGTEGFKASRDFLKIFFPLILEINFWEQFTGPYISILLLCEKYAYLGRVYRGLFLLYAQLMVLVGETVVAAICWTPTMNFEECWNPHILFYQVLLPSLRGGSYITLPSREESQVSETARICLKPSIIHCFVTNYHITQWLKIAHIYYFTVMVGEKYGYGLAEPSSLWCLTRLQSTCQPGLGSHLKAHLEEYPH